MMNFISRLCPAGDKLRSIELRAVLRRDAEDVRQLPQTLRQRILQRDQVPQINKEFYGKLYCIVLRKYVVSRITHIIMYNKNN